MSCTRCDCQPRPGIPPKTEAEAIAAWNTRTSAHADSARLIAMAVGALERIYGEVSIHSSGYARDVGIIAETTLAALRAQAPAVEQTGEK